MSDIKLFTIQDGKAKELKGSEAALEKSLQVLIENNLDVLLGINFLASEYSTGPIHGGRIDSLGLDENHCPVIIEYKRSTNENVINQGLYYLDWLMDHQAEFKLLVMEKLGKEIADEIEWIAPRLLCIAGGFTKFDSHAVKQINRNIELIKYSHFEGDLLAFELINAIQAESKSSTGNVIKPSSTASSNQYKHFEEYLSQSDQTLKDLFDQFDQFCQNLGDDVQVKTLKFYQAYKRIKNFACAEVRPSLGHVLVFLKLNPDSIDLIDGFSRDVRGVGHYGTGDLEITIRSMEDLDKAKSLIVAAFENN
ncbi:MAG: DUF5655 domain-containing protein [Porticoccaceae bacterium]